ncbi:MAG: response regulator [Candidatus Margulisiibacteriota bacterium]
MQNKKILLVDDELDMAEMVKLRLEANGYTVAIAVDGQQAFDMARESLPDLIVLDIMLPKIDGYQVCRMLKSDEKYKNIPIIIFSARVQDPKFIYDELGANGYIPKPFDPKKLLDMIKELLKE